MTVATPALPEGVRVVSERAARVAGRALSPVPGWDEAFPWLVHGTTGDDVDLGLFGATPVGEALGRWRALRTELGASRAVHSEQVHGAEVLVHEAAEPGLLIGRGYDGHVTAVPGTLLTVSIADCVPIFLVDPVRRRIGLLHGGWRGTAVGVVERGIAALGGDPAAIHAHLGPAICGACYEVGPEVHAALGLPAPGGRSPVDLRAVQTHRLVAAGIPPGQGTVSDRCTRCGDGFFSHRAGSRGRQLGVLAIRREGR